MFMAGISKLVASIMTNELSIDKVKDKIYPWIKVMFDPDEKVPDSNSEIELSEDDSPVNQTWLGNLSIFYAFDEGDYFSLILNRQLNSTWTLEKLHDIAVSNLERDIEYQYVDCSFGGHGLIAGGDHEAGALCLPNIWEWCAEQNNDDLIVAVPAKDMVVMVPSSDKEKLPELKKLVQNLFQDGERLLTRQLYKYDRNNKTWTLFDTVN